MTDAHLSAPQPGDGATAAGSSSDVATAAGSDEAPSVGRGWWVAGAITVVALVPLLFLGPGTDLDVGAVLRSGQGIVSEGTYVASRTPGAPVHEAIVGLLDRVGGVPASNLGSLLAAAATALLLGALLRTEGATRIGLTVAVVVANPWFLVAATSTVDFLWAMALFLAALVVLRRRPGLAGGVGAGVLAGLAVGARASTALLVAMAVLAEVWEPPETGRRRRTLAFATVAAATGLLAFLPPYLAADTSLAFAQNDVPTSSPLVQLGRFLVKDLYFVGPFAAVVLLLCLPAVARALGRWRGDWLVRIGLLVIAASQLLFLRFPWKMGHLLPTLIGLALLLGRALGDRPRLLVALVVAQLLYGAVSITLIEPDNPNAATGGRLTFTPHWGALVVDVQCRAEDPDAWEGPGIDRITEVWDCAKPWAR